jgi:hypothetical protein
MKHEKKFSSQEQQASETQSRQATAREFASVEELLRFDAGQTAVPPAIAERLGQSVGNEPNPSRPWWRRWLNQK